MSKKQILLNAFQMNCVGHIQHGLWTHPQDRSIFFNDLDYWTSLARTLERYLFDGIFIADIFGYYDVYKGNVDITLKESVQLPTNDPWTLVSGMAAVTNNLGLGITATIRAENPYAFARRVSSLDHLTKGRLGWNIVTGYSDSGARGLGYGELEKHDERYDRADEFMEVVYKLWEGSWADDAVVVDRTRRVYARPDRVRAIEHNGAYYKSNAIHGSSPSPQRTPLLFQAGASDRGRAFAGKHAEAAFISAPTIERARELSRKIRKAAIDAGRKADDVKVFAGLAVVVAATQKVAREKFDEYLKYANPEANLTHFSASVGIDFSKFDLDAPIDYGVSNYIQTSSEYAAERRFTVRDLLREKALSSHYHVIVGDAAQAASEIERWIDEGELDGVNLSRVVVPGSWEDFGQLVIPELQNRGRFKTAYGEGTLRHKVFGYDRLQDNHPAARYRFA
ncbi:MAG: LLM class flavin-dependent oxidoreductase [Helicobacteraceae bacterium]|jgi:FMN-dependent oxidoreductase (nitrilotriacetate monooxygenase family)|nr:LLM class flavin-dependent oxidoreductase [Helicobacteraceae bacterium]